MAGVKISNLTAIPVAAALADEVASVQGGTTYKETLQQVNDLFETTLTALTGLTGAISAPTSLTGATAFQVRTGTTAADALTLAAYNAGGASYTVFGTLTAHASAPTCVFDGASVTNIPNTGLSVMDSNASHALSIVPGSDLSAARVFTLTTGDADRMLTLTGNLAMSGAFNLTCTITGNTNVTFPTSGTLATVGGTLQYEADVTGTVAMAVNTGYVCNAAGLTTLTLPAVAAVGKIVAVVGQGAGGWLIAQNASQFINVIGSSTTTGVGGSLASTNADDAAVLICTGANNEWTVINMTSAGLTIV